MIFKGLPFFIVNRRWKINGGGDSGDRDTLLIELKTYIYNGIGPIMYVQLSTLYIKRHLP